MRILIVDDEQILLDQLKSAFEGQRYMVETALDGEEVLDKLFEISVDLIILDIMLPKQDGLSVLRKIRQAGMATPVLMLTEQVLRMERLVKNLLGLSSLEIQGTTTKETVDVAEVLASLLVDYSFLANTRNIQIEARLPRQLLTDGNVDTLKRAFSNILDNAIKYNVDGGQIEVIGTQSSVDLVITVTNTGLGVAKAEIDKVFDQFYRVEQSRSLQHGGSGLGLAIVKRIVELHNGLVKFESQQGNWTRVTVNLPRHREEISV